MRQKLVVDESFSLKVKQNRSGKPQRCVLEVATGGKIHHAGWEQGRGHGPALSPWWLWRWEQARSKQGAEAMFLFLVSVNSHPSRQLLP